MANKKPKIIKKLPKPLLRIKKKAGRPLRFLSDGRTGGMILDTALGAWFLCGLPGSLFGLTWPRAALFAAVLPVCVLAAEAVGLLIRIVFGAKRRGMGYFLLPFVAVAMDAVSASFGLSVLPELLLALVAALETDCLGRCLWSVIVKKNRRSVFGYIAMGLAAAVMALFGAFCLSDGFSDSDVIEKYAEMRPTVSAPAEGFDEYIQNGAQTVRTLIYGPDETCDIVTPRCDISDLAVRDGFSGKRMDSYFGYSLEEVPIAGKIWYPEGGQSCPVMFIVHGNHEYTVPSYLGYDYLGEYLASHGYVVVSVDENCCNCLGGENDARAYLMLENIEKLLEQNRKSESPLYGVIDPESIAIAGHSRGGESIATAYLFNSLTAYPENGHVRFGYDFNIKSLIAIAPCADQYMPSGRAVKLENVNYLLLHGSNDQDVYIMQGEKQYGNISFTDGEEYIKASVYIAGANHGQFNTQWGRYDQSGGIERFLDVKGFITENEQQTAAKAFILAFLDKTLRGDDTYAGLLRDVGAYREYLPETAYYQCFENSSFDCITDFEGDCDIFTNTKADVKIRTGGFASWSEEERVMGGGGDGENHVLRLKWLHSEPENGKPYVEFVTTGINTESFSFDIADMRDEDVEAEPLLISVTLEDANGRKAKTREPLRIYPSLPVPLTKLASLTGTPEYKHVMQTVTVSAEQLEAETGFDSKAIKTIHIEFSEMETGDVQLDNIGTSPKNA